ncbi:hypothetical protein EJD97_013614, partial [Solanum chilense]
MATCAAKITWLIGLYKELGVNVTVSVRMICESKTTILIAINPIFHECTKHIDIDCHFVKENLSR